MNPDSTVAVTNTCPKDGVHLSVDVLQQPFVFGGQGRDMCAHLLLLHVEHGHMPAWAQDDPHAYWQAADAHERANGRLYSEVQFALPRELDAGGRRELPSTEMEPQEELQQLLARQAALTQELAAKKKALQEAQRRQRTTLTRQIRPRPGPPLRRRPQAPHTPLDSARLDRALFDLAPKGATPQGEGS